MWRGGDRRRTPRHTKATYFNLQFTRRSLIGGEESGGELHMWYYYINQYFIKDMLVVQCFLGGVM
jgi:hypothetical protein